MSVMVLSCGVDTLVLNVIPLDAAGLVARRPLPDVFQQELEAYKLAAQEEDEPIETRWDFEGAPLFMRPKGGRAGFQWILEHPDFTLAISRGKRALMLGQVRLSSRFLWSCASQQTAPSGVRFLLPDLAQAVVRVHAFLSEFYEGAFMLQLSAIDLCADVLGFDVPSLDARDCFITRATFDDVMPASTPAQAFDGSLPSSSSPSDDGFLDGPDSIKRRWRRITGLSFGVRNAAVSALLYDKTYDIRYHCPDKAWCLDLWSTLTRSDGTPVYDGSSPVWRIELRFKREALAEADVNDIYEVLPRLSAMWAYAVGHPAGGPDGLPDGWLRYVVPSADLNRSRWPVHPDWHVIQSAFTDLAALEASLLAPLPAAAASASAPVSSVPLPFEECSDGELSVPAAVPVPAGPAPLSCAPFVRRRERHANMHRALAAVSGWCATIEAWRIPSRGDEDYDHVCSDILPDLSSTLHFLANNIPAYLSEFKKREVERDFSSLVQVKRKLYRRTAVSAGALAAA